MSAVQKRIQACFGDCYRLAESCGAGEWLKQALDAAREGERGHRRMGARFTNGAARYRLPVSDAARYFACKFFLDASNLGEAQSFEQVMRFREDCRLAYAARDRVCQPERSGNAVFNHGPKSSVWHDLRGVYADVLALDYSNDVAVRS